MDDKKTWMAVLVSIAFIMVYTQYVIEPYQNTLKPAQTQQTIEGTANTATTLNSAVQAGATQIAPGVVNSSATSLPSIEEVNSSPSVIVETDRFIAKLSPFGGRFASLKLKGYRFNQSEDKLVDLVAPSPTGDLPGTAFFGSRSDAGVKYNVTGIGELVADTTVRSNGNQRSAVQFTGQLDDGSTIIKQFEFSGDSFIIDTSLQVVDGPSVPQPIWLEWNHLTTNQESHQRLNPLGFKLLSDQDKVVTTTVLKAIDGPTPVAPYKWLSIEDKYFLTSIIPGTIAPNGNTVVSTYQNGDRNLAMRGLVGTSTGTIKLFAGPKDTRILDAAGF